MFLDRAGLLWVGTDDGGVNTVSTKPFLFRHALGDSLRILNRVQAVLGDMQGSLWIGAIGNGAWRFNPTTQRSTRVWQDVVVTDFYQDKEGTVWACTPTDLIGHDPRSNTYATIWRIPHDGEIGNRVFIDSDGFAWVGTNRSVYRVRRDMKEYTHYVRNRQNPRSFTGGPVESIFEDKWGNIWVGTWSGLNKFNKQTQSFTRFFHDEQDSSSLSDNYCTGILEDESGRLWISTRLGLNRFNETDSTFTRFLNQPVERIVCDQRGHLWFATTGGIAMFDPSDGSVKSFDASDGIPDVKVWGWCRTLMKSGELVFGAGTGILVFHPDSAKTLTYVPPVVITGITKFRKPMHLQISPELLGEIAFEHDENVFSIEYAALSYDMPEFNQYAYKLDGFDRDWVHVGNKREAVYTNLDPGAYTFRVKGSNHDGVWNETGTSLTVIIRPALWQTWWFKLLATAAFLGLLTFIYRREVTRLRKDKLIQQEFSRRQIESQESERKRLAAELHDGLGQDLLVMNNELQQFLQESKEPNEELKQVASLLQESIEGVREISANLHPHHLDRLGFGAAVEAMTENLSRSTVLAIQQSCDDIDRLLPKETEIHVYRIIQEALSNIVRHASAKNVNVQVKKNPESIEINVTDDGKGFNVHEALERRSSRAASEQFHGLGLSSINERVRIIGGTMKIESSPGSGTTVHVSLPYS